jgi:hypothetical protein
VDIEDSFLLQQAKAIQTWLWIESELFSMYSMFMQGANNHLVSATFNCIQSVDSKLALLNTCFVLVFERNGDELRSWKTLQSKLGKLNKKRNKLVHEPVHIHYNNGNTTISQGPSYFNALVLARGQTTLQSAPTVSADFHPSKVCILDDHRLSQSDVATLEKTFRETAHELQAYRESVAPKVANALLAAKKESL